MRIEGISLGVGEDACSEASLGLVAADGDISDLEVIADGEVNGGVHSLECPSFLELGEVGL